MRPKSREQAIQSQAREALQDPLSEEPVDVWELRLSRLRDHLTDFYFAYNLPYELFEQIVRDTLAERGVHVPRDDGLVQPRACPTIHALRTGGCHRKAIRRRTPPS